MSVMSQSSESVGETDVREGLEKRYMRPVRKRRTSYPYPRDVYEVPELKHTSRWMRRLQTYANGEGAVEGAAVALETVVEYCRRSKLKNILY